MNTTEVVSRIAVAFPDGDIMVDGADCNFTVAVTSSGFAGLRPVQRQQMVLRLFSSELSTGELHALSISALTPEEAATPVTASSGLTAISG